MSPQLRTSSSLQEQVHPNSNMPKWLRSWGECSDLPVAAAEGGPVGRASRLVAIFFLLGYRTLISPFFPASCRFHPSCSGYAMEAIARHGVGRGMLLAVGRLLRCQPLNPGGYDPVPEAGKSSGGRRPCGTAWR